MTYIPNGTEPPSEGTKSVIVSPDEPATNTKFGIGKEDASNEVEVSAMGLCLCIALCCSTTPCSSSSSSSGGGSANIMEEEIIL